MTLNNDELSRVWRIRGVVIPRRQPKDANGRLGLSISLFLGQEPRICRSKCEHGIANQSMTFSRQCRRLRRSVGLRLAKKFRCEHGGQSAQAGNVKRNALVVSD